MPGVNSYQGGFSNTPAAGYTGNVPVPQQGSKYGDGVISKLKGDYGFATWNNLVYDACSQAGQVTTVGLATTYTGMGIFNPPASGINMEILEVAYAFPVVAAADIVIGLMTGYSAAALAGVTLLSPVNSNGLVNGISGKGQSFSAATLVAPILRQVLGTVGSSAVTAVATLPMTVYPVKGRIILQPGCWCAFYTSTASGASGFLGSMSWMETIA